MRRGDDRGDRPATGRVLRAEGRFAGPGPQVQCAAVYADSRQVQGVVVPFHEENFAQENQTGLSGGLQKRLLGQSPRRRTGHGARLSNVKVSSRYVTGRATHGSRTGMRSEY